MYKLTMISLTALSLTACGMCNDKPDHSDMETMPPVAAAPPAAPMMQQRTAPIPFGEPSAPIAEHHQGRYNHQPMAGATGSASAAPVYDTSMAPAAAPASAPVYAEPAYDGAEEDGWIDLLAPNDNPYQ